MMENSLVVVKNFRCRIWVQDKHKQSDSKATKGEKKKSILLIKFRSAKENILKIIQKKKMFMVQGENW